MNKESRFDRFLQFGPLSPRTLTQKIFEDNWEAIEAYAIECHTPYNGDFPIEDALAWATDTLMFDMNYGGLSVATDYGNLGMDVLEDMKRRVCEYANEYAGEYTKNP